MSIEQYIGYYRQFQIYNLVTSHPFTSEMHSSHILLYCALSLSVLDI